MVPRGQIRTSSGSVGVGSSGAAVNLDNSIIARQRRNQIIAPAATRVPTDIAPKKGLFSYWFFEVRRMSRQRRARGRRQDNRVVFVVGLMAAVVLAGGVVYWKRTQVPAKPKQQPSSRARLLKLPVELVLEREKLDKTVWSDEVRSQQYEEPFIRLWDALRSATDKAAVLGGFPFQKLLLGAVSGKSEHDHNIEVLTSAGVAAELDQQGWRDWLADWKEAEFQLVESEWHHSRFEPDGNPPQSVVSMTLHVIDRSSEAYYLVKGNLTVEWSAEPATDGSPVAQRIDATQMKIYHRRQSVLFDNVATISLKEIDQQTDIPMLIAGDLDDDGLSDLLLPASNIVYWNRGDWTFERDKLLKDPPSRPIRTALLADFTADGRSDLLAAIESGLMLYPADRDGQFSLPPRKFDCDPTVLQEPMVFTAGDIDGDGDLDVFLGQYKLPYFSGQMPTPYYDANDGFPSFLFLNLGGGEFRDVTEAAGLGKKRFRRTYSACLVDLDDDLDLDLLVASDFAGLDVYHNNGDGNFTDVTKQIIDKRHAFGMALTLGDYNLDSQLDFMMIGMSSTTARRLDQLGLGRDEFPAYQELRREMGYGNRMYLAFHGKFRQAPFNDQVARTGWSWGTTSFDFDNDGDRDIYVVNGHKSGTTAKDYCTRFWCHDIYTGGSKHDLRLAQFFQYTMQTELAPISWNGYEHNVLLMNEAGSGFLNIGFLAGVAFEFDSRSALSDDMNGDGQVDLVVIGKPVTAATPNVYILKNQTPEPGNWIGLRFGGNALGAYITVRTVKRTHTGVITAGDSLRSQHAPTAHFGLGDESHISEVLVQWPDQRTARLSGPSVNQYHHIKE